MASAAERKLETITHKAETKRWNFEKFVRLHKEQHATLLGLTQHGYSGIDERSKVRHLMAGIKTSNLDSVKAQILASSGLRNSFDACVDLCQSFIRQQASAASAIPILDISPVTT